MASNNENITLICKRVMFYSPKDKHAFFNTLSEIKSIKEVKGERDSIILTLDDKYISQEDVQNLTALFRRYFICLEQLEALGDDDDGFPRYHCYEAFTSYCVYPTGKNEAAVKKKAKKDIPEGEIVLKCNAEFYEEDDQEAFFMWLNKIEAVSKITGRGESLKIHVPQDKNTYNDLYSLLALYIRYNIPDMEQFQQFLTDENKDWFKDKYKFWYKKVFGNKK